MHSDDSAAPPYGSAHNTARQTSVQAEVFSLSAGDHVTTGRFNA